MRTRKWYYVSYFYRHRVFRDQYIQRRDSVRGLVIHRTFRFGELICQALKFDCQAWHSLRQAPSIRRQVSRIGWLITHLGLVDIRFNFTYSTTVRDKNGLAPLCCRSEAGSPCKRERINLRGWDWMSSLNCYVDMSIILLFSLDGSGNINITDSGIPFIFMVNFEKHASTAKRCPPSVCGDGG